MLINVKSKFELDLKEPKTLKKLKDDFEIMTSKINDFTIHVVNDTQDSDHSGNNSPGRQATKVSFVRGLKIDDDKLTQNLLRFFVKELRKRPNINILTTADILIPED